VPETVRRDRKRLSLDLTGQSPSGKRETIVGGIAALRETLGVTETLGDLGVTKKDIPVLARNAMQDPCMATNPRHPTQKEIERIYEEAL